jgi:hypothetical protein
VRRASASTLASAGEPPSIAAQVVVGLVCARAPPLKARHARHATPASDLLSPRGPTYGFTNLSVIRSLSPIASYFA